MLQWVLMKKPILVAIFAHPDDEAFGPSGTLALYSKTHDVYILCATRGEAGQNHNTESMEETIGDIREREVKASAKVIGVKEVRMLGFEDGAISNNLYHIIADKIMTHLEELKPEILMTFEPRGISGHIDHMAIAMITSYVFEKTSSAKELLYHCIGQSERETLKDYFIYVPPGYAPEEIDKVVDVSSVWGLKIQAIKQHRSQTKDGSKLLKEMINSPKEEYFLLKKKG